jgi:hypothetical protein
MHGHKIEKEGVSLEASPVVAGRLSVHVQTFTNHTAHQLNISGAG